MPSPIALAKRGCNFVSDSAPPSSSASPRTSLRAALWALPLGALLLASGLCADWYVGLPPGREATFVGVQKCATCHPAQFNEWKGSNHDRAMEVATEATVLGDFNDHLFEHKNPRTGEHYGDTSRLFKRDGKFYINTEGPHGEMQDFEIKYTYGVAPLQQYLVELDRGKMQALSVAWDTSKKEWFLLDVEGERIHPGDPLHWTNRALNWNHMCADCHSTNVVKNYDVASGKFNTTYSEINVGCEACHGPGSIHVELAESRSLFWDRHYGYGLAKLKGTSTKAQLETCAKCHSRRQTIAEHQRAGDELLDHYIPEMLDTATYHPDGQILPAEEAYEYGSFLQSKMYRKGIRCSDCHNPHSTKLIAQGNALCNRCHTKSTETGVVFDSPAHTFHPIGSKGAQCVECHMPQTNYMLVDPRRDHSIRIPRPDVSVQLKKQYGVDVPNACNRCHKPADAKPAGDKPDGDAAWAAAKIDEWYGPKRKELRQKHPHFGMAIAGGRALDPTAIADLIALSEPKQKENVGPIVRASAVRLLGRYDTEATQKAVAAALADPEPLVRYAATIGVETRPAGVKRELLSKMLEDPVRAVRIQAMKGMLDRQAGAPSEAAFPRVAAEYLHGIQANNDQAGAHFEQGLFHMNLNEDGKALAEFQTAIDLDPQFILARRYVANMLLDRQKPDEADKVMRDGVKKSPELAGAHFELGQYLLLDRAKPAEAVESLAQAVKLEPANAGFHYQYAVALNALQKPEEALRELEKACELDPAMEASRLELAMLLVQQGNYARGLEEAHKLLTRFPGNPTYRLVCGLLYEKLAPGEGQKLLASVRDRELLALFNQFAQGNRKVLALLAAQEILRREPGNPQFREIVRQLQAN